MSLIRTACAVRLLPLVLLLLTLPAVLQAQFTFVTNNGTLTITGYTGLGGAVTIPSTTNGLPVISIGPHVFYYCTSLINITIPDSVGDIGDYAFCFCTQLTSVMIGDGVTNIGSYAFYDCTSLTRVTIPDIVTSIEEGAFNNCTSLNRVTIGNRVTSIGVGAFYNCTNLNGVYFRGSAPSVRSHVFSGDDKATVYYLPGALGWGDFAGLPTVLWNPHVQTGDTSFGVQTNRFGFNISWASGMVVVVEACTNLANPIWLPLQTNSLATDSSYFSDLQWTNYPARFYRLRWP